ncbi:hypothetical protein HDU92_005272 [Lobulomyces angularis]|nr:hypothetical protein HDU92_005272 [Lobulomyces angularis]
MLKNENSTSESNEIKLILERLNKLEEENKLLMEQVAKIPSLEAKIRRIKLKMDQQDDTFGRDGEQNNFWFQNDFSKNY